MSYVVIFLFMLLSAVFATFLAYWNHTLWFDFEGTLWEPAHAIREGSSPYPAPVRAEIEIGNPALYPPFLMLPVVALTLMPWSVAVTIWVCASVASIVGALYLLGVRDGRCYALALICGPVVGGVLWGNATLLLVPLVALAWRWREHAYRAGAVLGIAIAAKLFLWPLVFWLAGTRRYRAAAAAAVAAVVAIIAPWAVIGFEGLTSYPDVLRIAEGVYATHSFSVATMLNAIGVDADLAARGAVAVGVILAATAFWLGRRAKDEASFSTSVLAAILGSPIVWPYYYALVLVPIAIARPRFSGIWAALVLFYLVYRLPRPWLDASDVADGSVACCIPADVPLQVWITSHAPAGLWPAVGHAALAAILIVSIGVASSRANTKRALALDARARHVGPST